jgi:hypothetical protein
VRRWNWGREQGIMHADDNAIYTFSPTERFEWIRIEDYEEHVAALRRSRKRLRDRLRAMARRISGTDVTKDHGPNCCCSACFAERELDDASAP